MIHHIQYAQAAKLPDKREINNNLYKVRLMQASLRKKDYLKAQIA